MALFIIDALNYTQKVLFQSLATRFVVMKNKFKICLKAEN